MNKVLNQQSHWQFITLVTKKKGKKAKKETQKDGKSVSIKSACVKKEK